MKVLHITVTPLQERFGLFTSGKCLPGSSWEYTSFCIVLLDWKSLRQTCMQTILYALPVSVDICIPWRIRNVFDYLLNLLFAFGSVHRLPVILNTPSRFRNSTQEHTDFQGNYFMVSNRKRWADVQLSPASAILDHAIVLKDDVIQTGPCAFRMGPWPTWSWVMIVKSWGNPTIYVLKELHTGYPVFRGRWTSVGSNSSRDLWSESGIQVSQDESWPNVAEALHKMFQLLPPSISNGLFRALMRGMHNKKDKAATCNPYWSCKYAWVRVQNCAVSSLNGHGLTSWFTNFEPTVDPELTSMVSIITTADDAKVIWSPNDVAFTSPLCGILLQQTVLSKELLSNLFHDGLQLPACP